MPQVDVLFFLQVIGVAQVINKSKGEEVFTSKDEEVKTQQLKPNHLLARPQNEATKKGTMGAY